MASARLWTKMIGVGALLCIGGPALVIYVTPTEEELFKKYNPELQKRSLANREKNKEEFDVFVGKLKGYSQSNKPIWEAAAEADAQDRERVRLAARQLVADEKARKEEIRGSVGRDDR